MSIIVCGINHKTAPLVLREKAVFTTEKLPLYLADLSQQENIQEAVILSTCNRSEVYCNARDIEIIRDWYARQHQLTHEQLNPFLYVYDGRQAVEHIMKVACGLDSMVLGESQILGQMKSAFSESCAAGTVGPLFNRLFQQVFAVAKEARTNTAVGACPVSVASTAVGLAKQVSSLSAAQVLVIGAGDTVELVLRHLKANGAEQIVVANRSLENAEVLAKTHAVQAVSFAQLPAVLAVADIVISATGSALPVVSKDMMQAALALRQHKKIAIIDIAVPRDIEPSVAELDAVALYCIDDLKTIIQHNLRGREHAAEKVFEVIQARSVDFLAWQESLDMVATTIRAYRAQIEDICHAELVKARRQLQRGDEPAQVMEGFAHAFMNKLLHTPSVQLRQAGLEGRFDILQLAQQLFALPQSELELL